MSKCIKTVSLSNIESVEIYQNTSKLRFQEIVDLKKPDIAVNGSYFDGLWQPAGHVKSNGTVLSTEPWGAWGYAWDTGSDIQMKSLPCDSKSYISCLDLINPWDGANATLNYDKTVIGGNRGRTAIGLGEHGLTIVSVGDGTSDATTPENIRDLLVSEGCTTGLALDGGSSSHSYIDGNYILSSRLKVQNVILIYLKDEPVKTTATLYRVQVGAFSVKANAEKMMQKLSDAGFSGFITEVEV